MDAFSKILGGQMPAEVGNLIDQFNQGAHEDVPDEQVSSSYGQVAAQLPQDQYEAAAADAFNRLTPEQRAQFAQWLRTQAPQHGVSTPAVQQASPDPGSLAAATAQVHAEQPNLLQQMFAPGGTFSSPIAKAALLGITAMAAQRMMGSRR